MKKLYLILIASLILPILILVSMPGVLASIEIDTCRELNQSNDIYILNSSVAAINPFTLCFDVKGTNITLDMNGFNSSGFASSFIKLTSGDNFTMSNGLINNSGSRIILYSASFNATFKNINIDTSVPVVNFNGNNRNLYLINVTYVSLNEGAFGTNNYIYRYWIYKAEVNDSLNNNLNGVNITIFDKDNIYYLNLTTNSSGLTDNSYLLEYLKTSADQNYSSPYNIYASLSLYDSQNHTLNITDVRNYLDSFTLTLTPVPVIPPVIPADDGLTRTILKLLVGFLALVVLGISLLVMKWWDQRSKIEAEDVVKYFVVLLLAIILVGVLASIIWGML